MRISDWSSDVCSSDLLSGSSGRSRLVAGGAGERLARLGAGVFRERAGDGGFATIDATFQHSEEDTSRSEEHTSELQSLMRISYAVFCLKKKIKDIRQVIRTNL